MVWGGEDPPAQGVGEVRDERINYRHLPRGEIRTAPLYVQRPPLRAVHYQGSAELVLEPVRAKDPLVARVLLATLVDELCQPRGVAARPGRGTKITPYGAPRD